MAKTIAVALPKGGVGKTTTAVNLAASLAVAEKRTLLVDMDSLGASGLSLGFTERTTKYGVYEVFNFIAGIREATYKTELKFLNFVPAHVTSLQMEDRLMKLADNRSMMRIALKSVHQEYEYIILDCPPILRGLSTNALAAADSVLMTVKSGHFALGAVDKLFKHIQWLREVTGRPLDIEGILLTMHEPSTRVADITVRELQAKYGQYMLKTVIPRNTMLGEASFYGKPAVLYRARSKGSTAYLALAKEIIARNPSESTISTTPDSCIISPLGNQA